MWEVDRPTKVESEHFLAFIDNLAIAQALLLPLQALSIIRTGVGFVYAQNPLVVNFWLMVVHTDRTTGHKLPVLASD